MYLTTYDLIKSAILILHHFSHVFVNNVFPVATSFSGYYTLSPLGRVSYLYYYCERNLRSLDPVVLRAA